MPEAHDETTYYRYARRIDGRLEPIDIARHNGRLVPRFDPSWTEPVPEDLEPALEIDELLDELSYNLSALERRTWLKLLDGQPIERVAISEGVSRAAVYGRIRGGSDRHGGMVKKNDYVRIWWDRRRKGQRTSS